MLQDLALPHYHHEFVKAAVELLFEYPDKATPLTVLLKSLSETGVITSTQMAQVRMKVFFWGGWTGDLKQQAGRLKDSQSIYMHACCKGSCCLQS